MNLVTIFYGISYLVWVCSFLIAAFLSIRVFQSNETNERFRKLKLAILLAVVLVTLTLFTLFFMMGTMAIMDRFMVSAVNR